MNVRELIRESVSNALAEAGKKDYPEILMRMNPQDRKTIKYWNVRDDENISIISLFSTLVGQGMLEFITEFVDRNRGAFRLFPDSGLICIEMKVQKRR
jgi:hypothetical protein